MCCASLTLRASNPRATRTPSPPPQEYLERKYGKGAGSRMAANLEIAGRANGIQFNNERKVHNTLKSHRLVRVADAQDKGDQMIEQLFHGYFEEGKNIADVGVLLELAGKVCMYVCTEGFTWFQVDR